MSDTINSAFTNLDTIIENSKTKRGEKIRAMLQLGLEIYRLDMAIVSKIENQRYYVVYSQPDSQELKPGTIFDFGTTYCNITVNFPIPVAIHHARISEHHRHPCRELFNLEAYIGTKFRYSTNHNGTLNFSGVDPRNPFSSTERELIARMGREIEQLLR